MDLFFDYSFITTIEDTSALVHCYLNLGVPINPASYLILEEKMNSSDTGVNPIIYPILGAVFIIGFWIVILFFPCNESSTGKQCKYSYIGGYTRTGDCPGEECTQLWLTGCGAAPAALGFGLVSIVGVLAGVTGFISAVVSKPDPQEEKSRAKNIKESVIIFLISAPISVLSVYTLLELRKYLL